MTVPAAPPIPADGYCPTCGALAEETCVAVTAFSTGKKAIPDHKRRHPMPPAPERTTP